MTASRDAAEGAQPAGPFEVVTDVAALAGCSLVVEAVPELVDLKHDVLRRIAAAAPGAAIGSNTSSLSIDVLADDGFVVDTTGGREAMRITTELRGAGFAADRAYDNRSMKSQMKAADRSGAQVAVIIGSMAVATIASLVKARFDAKKRGSKLLDEVPHFTSD